MFEKDRKSKEKIKKEKQIFWDQKNEPFTWKDIKDIQFEDDDMINISWVEPYYSEDNSYDGHYHAEVVRLVEETDEQFQKRMADIEREEKWAKERRLQSYLKLKAEFEPDTK